MKNLFRKIPFSVKLAIVGIVPLVFVIYLSVQVLQQQGEKMEILRRFSRQLDQSSTLIKLIDNLQSERRYTFGYSLNVKWENAMLTARAKTDEALVALENNYNDQMNGFRSYTLLDKLAETRTEVTKRQLNTQDIMDYYMGVILRLNNLSNLSTENLTYLEPVNKELRGELILSQMITYLGILRASYYHGLSIGEPIAALASRLKDDYNVYRSLENEFTLKSSVSSVTEFYRLKKETALENTLGEFGAAIAHRSSSSQLDPEEWWDISAGAVDDLKKLHRQLLNEVEAKSGAIYDREQATRNKNVVFVVLVILLVMFIVVYTIKNISEVLNELNAAARKIAIGVTGNNLVVYSDDVVGELTRSIQLVDKTNIQMANAAFQIGRGNFDVEVVPRSEDDQLGNAVATMKHDLKKFNLENDLKLWLQEGNSVVYESMGGEKNVVQLARDSLKAVVTYLGAQTALLYTADHSTLHFTAGYAIDNPTLVPQFVKFGETVLGQVAADKKPMYLTNVPGEHLKVVSASGETVPTQLLIFPLVNNDIVEGVIEIASIYPIPEKAQQLMQLVAPGIAVNILTARNRAKLKELLEETQAQAEELKVQHSELENINAELEAHTEKLQVSEEELRVQQEELQQTNQELEEGSLLLKEKNLEVERKAEELEAATRYKSEFLANMSHELRTPLNSILLLSRLLAENADKNLNLEEIEYAQVIQSSGQGLLAMIDEILDLSKIEAGKMEVEKMEVELEEIGHEMTRMFRNLAIEKDITFTVDKAPNVPAKIVTDKGRVEQILKNLISNAIKFTSKGGVTLEMSRFSPTTIAFAVQDSGIGIPAEKQKLIFEAFQQADGSTKRKYGGTGLGLSISRELSKLLGGMITLSSSPNAGSRFTFYLPITPEQTIEPLEKAPETDATEKETQTSRYLSKVIPENIADDRAMVTGHDKVILIIEDDIHFAKALLDFTRKKGYKGVVSVRGDEGPELALHYKPIGILLDIELPMIDGLEVLDLLKKNPATRHIPVHIMSSHRLKNESLLKGAINFIDKPVAVEQMQEVFQRIEQVIGRKSRKVLIIEDNPQHAKALSYFLETSNVEAIIKQNIEAGVESLKKDEVDCVILDMGIPDIKSYEILDQAKKSPGLGNIPIIVFTGKSLSKTEESKINQYANSIVVKTAHSYKRVLEEISIFLHLVDEKDGKVKRAKKVGSLGEVLHNRTVLIVDDDVRNIFSLTRSLENYKMNVITANDGKEALDVLNRDQSVDIVLLDMMMPRLDGYETAKAIREDQRLKQLPVIAVTAKAMTGDREKCISAGASDYITKPVDIDQLTSLLRVWLYERPGAKK